MVEYFFLVALPEGEHKAAADKAPGGDSKDAADEKMEGKWNRKCIGLWTLGLIVVQCQRTDIQPSCTRGEGISLQNSSAIETQRAQFGFPIRPLGIKAFYGKTRLIEVGRKTEITKSALSSYYACLIGCLLPVFSCPWPVRIYTVCIFAQLNVFSLPLDLAFVDILVLFALSSLLLFFLLDFYHSD